MTTLSEARGTPEAARIAIETSPGHLAELNNRLSDLQPSEILEWAWATFAPDVIASSSFQTQSVPLLHLISQHAPELVVCFVDTGYHFPETIAFRDHLAAALDLEVRVLKAREPASRLQMTEEPYRADPDQCCFVNKVEPMRRALRGQRAWITGIRRDQTATREEADYCTIGRDGVIKVAPMLDWSKRDVDRYLATHRLPRHPLTEAGFSSIGCAPCTQAIKSGDDERAGRWANLAKTECGLHLDVRRST